MNPQILSHRQRIDALFVKIKSISNSAEQSEWSKYLCILVSGYIEESLRVLLENYTAKNSSQYIQNFVSTEIKNITNCKTKKILDILRSFNPHWEQDFNNKIATKSRIDDEIKNSIDSIITNRHSIAHGKNIGMSYSTVFNYYGNVKKAIEILEDVIK
jgi:uncharacterized HAD superfamily protein